MGLGIGASLVTALLLLLPEELLFRGYAFQRLVHAVGAWPGILVSAALRLKQHVSALIKQDWVLEEEACT